MGLSTFDIASLESALLSAEDEFYAKVLLNKGKILNIPLMPLSTWSLLLTDKGTKKWNVSILREADAFNSPLPLSRLWRWTNAAFYSFVCDPFFSESETQVITLAGAKFKMEKY